MGVFSKITNLAKTTKLSGLPGMSKTAQIMMTAVVSVCFVLLILGLLVINFIYQFEKSLLYAAGIMIGCVHSLIKVVLLEKSISRTLDIGETGGNSEHDAKRASNIAYLHYVGRFVLTGAVFVLVIIFPGIFGLFGAIIGVLSLQAAAIVTNAVLQKQEQQEQRKQQEQQESKEYPGNQ